MMNRTRWNELLARLNLGSDEQTFNSLEKSYSEKHRAYHTCSHIEACLDTLDSNRTLLNYPDSVEIAIWFHDAIYRPYSSENEEDSAKWAVEFMEERGASEELITEVSSLIIATKHNVAIHSNDQSVLVDIDLAILGAEPNVYARFEVDIRTEYKTVPKFIFKKKRAKLLRSFLDREYIFRCKPFRTLYESRARSNLEDAIQTLLR